VYVCLRAASLPVKQSMNAGILALICLALMLLNKVDGIICKCAHRCVLVKQLIYYEAKKNDWKR
jgi:hypothetical protein